MSGSTAAPLSFPSSGLYSGPFTAEEKVWVRDLAGYPFFGNIPSGFQSWRFMAAYGVLEFRLVDYNLQPNEYQLARQYVTDLLPLRAAILAASTGLDTDKAAVFTRNANEMAERQALYLNWRLRLCATIQVPPGPALQSQSSAPIQV